MTKEFRPAFVERIAKTIATYQGYRYEGLSAADKKFYKGQAVAVLNEVSTSYDH